ncbi:MAG TPA: hypothetical protein VFI47_14965 [Acidimicrobiales bacterium]|nr:hypothetical protein [Acidimicrobiales bacterium]
MAMLPDDFEDLEPFAEAWCLATEPERQDKRYSSSMPEIQALYDAVTPRAESAMTYLDRYTLDDLPADALNLMHLLFSWCTVSFAVECWSQPRVPDAGAAYLDLVTGPTP